MLVHRVMWRMARWVGRQRDLPARLAKFYRDVKKDIQYYKEEQQYIKQQETIQKVKALPGRRTNIWDFFYLDNRLSPEIQQLIRNAEEEHGVVSWFRFASNVAVAYARMRRGSVDLTAQGLLKFLENEELLTIGTEHSDGDWIKWNLKRPLPSLIYLKNLRLKLRLAGLESTYV